MHSRSLLITGTDTGVGKTFVACGLAEALVRRGLRVAPFKPAETGCAFEAETNTLIPADAARLQAASKTSASLELICPYRYSSPVAPVLAAAMENRSIEPAVLMNCFETLSGTHDIVLVESAGGILVPLAPNFHFGDLANMLSLPVLVVAGSKLGVINHTLLTLEYLQRAGLPVRSCVLNHPYRLSKKTGNIMLDEEPLLDHRAAVKSNVALLRELISTELFTVPGAQEATRREVDSLFDEMALRLFPI
jgi:dethiobiotin synthetase